MPKYVLMCLMFLILVGCKQYQGIRVCHRDTNNCMVYPDMEYYMNIGFGEIEYFCDKYTFSRRKITLTSEKNPNEFFAYGCKDYEFYPIWR